MAATTGAFEDLRYEVRDRVARIVFDRPDVLNAFTRRLYREAAAAVSRADGDPDVGVILLTGAGRAFGTGGDLREAERLLADGNLDGVREFAEAAHGLFTTVESVSKVVVTRVNGPAFGAGFVLVLCSDLAIAADAATMGAPEALLGLADPFVATRLPPRVGAARAKELMFTGRAISAGEAAEWGIVNRVVALGDLDAATNDLLAAVLRTGPEARALYKRLANAALPAFDIVPLRASLASAEARQGIRAFTQGLPPPWGAPAEHVAAPARGPAKLAPGRSAS